MPDAPPRVQILLIRHGQAGGPHTTYGPETALTPRGRLQAIRIADALKDLGIARIFTSPLRRARETALPTAFVTGIECEVDARLREFVMGDEDQAPIQEIAAERRDLMLWRPHDQLVDGGETLGAFQARVSEFVDEQARACPRETIAVFTHAGTIEAVLRWSFGLTAEHDWHSDVEVFNASITEVRHWPSGRHPRGAPFASEIARLNDVRHLDGDLITDF